MLVWLFKFEASRWWWLGPQDNSQAQRGAKQILQIYYSVPDRASPSCSGCSRAICPTISLSVWKSYMVNTCHLGLITHSVLVARAAPTWYQNLATAGCAWPVQVQSSNFSQGHSTRPILSPTCSPEPEWVHYMTSVWHSKSVVVRLSDPQWLRSIANLKLLMQWNRGLLQVKIIRLKKLYLDVYNHSCSCVCPSTKTHNIMAWIHSRSLGN